VVIADDHALFREGLISILQAQDGLQVVGEGASADAAISLARELQPEIALLDIDMPGGGLEAARVLAEECPDTKVCMLTASDADEHLVSALKLGARAFILKGVAARELVRILRSVAEGEVYVPPALAASLLVEMRAVGMRPEAEAPPALSSLTARETEILKELAGGLSNKEIAGRLFLSEKTVKHHVTNIFQKLQVRNRVEAALLARGKGRGSER